MPEVISFLKTLELTENGDRALLIGNGFSANYFNYSDLLAASDIGADTPQMRLFNSLNTVDFEIVVRALDEAAVVERAYGNEAHADELVAHAQGTREALVQAVHKTHPLHKDELAAISSQCLGFLNNFGTVFSLNYDLLLYWVNLENARLRDGFGKGSVTGRFLHPFKKDAYCDIYNLHGGLHLFQRNDGEIMKALNTGDGVIATITETILGDKTFPIYVAEGTWQAKLRKINSIGYLRHCYEMLLQNSATIFVYGHSAADNDSHIYRAIFSSKVDKVYFGIYQPDEEKLKVFDAQLSRFQKLGNSRINYAFFDAGSANVWGGT